MSDIELPELPVDFLELLRFNVPNLVDRHKIITGIEDYALSAVEKDRKKRQQPKPEPKTPEVPNTLIKVGGKPFRCECGCNVFNKPVATANDFACNACERTYEGES